MFFVMSAYLTGGLMMLFNPFITLLFGGRYCFPMTTVMVIVQSFTLHECGRRICCSGRPWGCSGTTATKRWRNPSSIWWASLVLVRQYGVTGIIWGTIISTLCTCAG